MWAVWMCVAKHMTTSTQKIRTTISAYTLVYYIQMYTIFGPFTLKKFVPVSTSTLRSTIFMCVNFVKNTIIIFECVSNLNSEFKAEKNTKKYHQISDFHFEVSYIFMILLLFSSSIVVFPSGIWVLFWRLALKISQQASLNTDRRN